MTTNDSKEVSFRMNGSKMLSEKQIRRRLDYLMSSKPMTAIEREQAYTLRWVLGEID